MDSITKEQIEEFNLDKFALKIIHKQAYSVSDCEIFDFMKQAALEKLSGGWISVEERLPDETGSYLAVVFGAAVTILYFSKRNGKWLNGDARHAICTHWQPLPGKPSKK